MVAVVAVTQLVASAQTTRSFTHFEARQTHSIALTPDGTRLLALNSPAASLSVFEVTAANAAPTRLAEIPVGLEPVAVRARTNDEVWVVNEVSDSVSIVSLSRKAVVATLAAGDEPADIVFAQGKAFVTCARNSLVRVFDAASKAELASIPLAGLDPRALATDATGSFVFAAFLLSGNRTTVLPHTDAPPQPPPTNPELPEAPHTSLIVAADDARISHSVLDCDVAMIEAASGQLVKYFSDVGTNLFDLALHPISGDVWVANTEARNLIRFEPVLRGHLTDHRLTRVAVADGATAILDLNAGIDYGTLPNPAAQAVALAQPTGLVFSGDGTLWLAAFASDRVAKIDSSTGEVLERIDVRSGGGDSSVMRGPRALALHPSEPRLFVLNKLAETISVVATDASTVIAEVPIASVDTMPATVRAGRGFLFDARLSGNGTASCAACHLDADRDGLAWDLGNPGGEMQTVMGANLSAHDTIPRSRVMHPMKGPMVTQTLRGMKDGAPFHWRGDRPELQSFNPAFDSLIGGSQLDEEDIDALAEYLLSLRHHPNPNRTKTGALPAAFAGGNPLRGEALFNLHNNHCAICHLPPKGTDNNIDSPQEVGSLQPVKNPSLATVYQRVFFDPRPGQESRSGFGLLHDGTGFALPIVHPYVLDELASVDDFNDVQAFVLCFDTGTSPVVGDTITVNGLSAAAAAGDLSRLENTPPLAGALVARGMIGGIQRRFTFSRTRQLYISEDFSDPPLTRAALLALLQGDDSLTFMDVQPFEAGRFAGGWMRQALLASDSYFVRNVKVPLSIPVSQGVMVNDAGVAPTHDAAAIVLPPALGQAALNPDGSFSYTPGPAFATAGLDGFDYTVLIATDPGNATDAMRATVSTMASAAGRYTGHVRADAGQEIAGIVKITMSNRGTWSGSIRLGAKVFPLRGSLGVDGQLLPARAPALKISSRLSALPDGERRISAQLQHAGIGSGAVLPRNPYSVKSPAPNRGRHKLDLSVSTASGGAPLTAGRATLVLGRTGNASLNGRLGDGKAFSCSGAVSPRPGGGWRFMSYSSVYKFPPGTVSGELMFDPAVPLAIGGTLTAVKPPQTRSGPYQTGFTIEYAVSKILPP
jgi:DNA-binding beta-propeller fold protein YncE